MGKLLIEVHIFRDLILILIFLSAGVVVGVLTFEVFNFFFDEI